MMGDASNGPTNYLLPCYLDYHHGDLILGYLGSGYSARGEWRRGFTPLYIFRDDIQDEEMVKNFLGWLCSLCKQGVCWGQYVHTSFLRPILDVINLPSVQRRRN
jgi:hypothetical protein